MALAAAAVLILTVAIPLATRTLWGALLTERARVRQLTTALAAPHTLTVFLHVRTSNNQRRHTQISTWFQSLGWVVEYGYTDLDAHADGVTVKGPSRSARGVLLSALRAAGIEGKEDTTEVEFWQVIVGTGDEPVVTPGELQKELLEARDLIKVRSYERDAARDAHGRLSVNFAKQRLKWCAERMKTTEQGSPGLPVHVTIRFAEYADHKLAKDIQSVLVEHTNWPVVLDNSNKPLIEPEDDFKVVFFIGVLGSFGEIFAAFHDGPLVAGKVGFRKVPLQDQSHLVIDILPTVANLPGT